MIVFAGAAGICLWGLVALLDSLQEPGLLRTTKGLAVKGCSSLDEHEDAPKRCPAFLCQKALFDRKLMTLDDRAEITSDVAEGLDRIISGQFVGKPQRFQCLVQGVTVAKAVLLEPTT